MRKLEYLALALAVLVVVGYGGRYLSPTPDIAAYCGSISLVDAQMMTANAGVAFDDSFKRCKDDTK